MTDEYFWTVILGVLGVVAVLSCWMLLQIRDRQRWHAENEAEERAAKAAMTPAE